MRVEDLPEFKECLELVMSFYGKDVTPAVISVWRAICQPFTLEQIKKAFNAHLANPDNGQFAPKPADIVRLLEGTKTDRSMVAWGKAHGAIAPVGAYRDVIFDDPIIHAVIEDMGGWVKFARTENDQLGYVQTQFCKSYQAYAARDDVIYPPFLPGAGSSSDEWMKVGLKAPKPTMVGDPEKCQKVYRLGSQNTQRITRVDQLIPANLQLTVEGAA